MMMTRQEAQDLIKHRVPCTDFLEKAPRGGYICPYCGSGSGKHGTGAVKYYQATNTCACHACPEPGQKARKFDVFDCIQAFYRCDYNEALQRGADYLRIEIAPNDRAGAAQSEFRGKGNKMHVEKAGKPQAGTGATTEADYTDYYMECMMRLHDPAALSYLQARGISEETAEAYKLGFDPAADPANAPGATEGTDKPHPAPRLIIPVTKWDYVARRTDGEQSFKAMHPKGSAAAIFNGDIVKEPGPVFIVEGAIDALSIIEAGGQAVALNSANNAGMFIAELEKTGAQCSFIICPDNDQKGLQAAETIARGLQRLHIKHIIANISGEHKDANDALIADRQELERAIKEAQAKAAAVVLPDYLTEFFDKISGDTYRPYKTDIEWFDRLLSGGPIRQTVLLLLAAPAAGKTTLCQQIAESMARHGKPVLYLNLEMSRDQMIAKSISARATFKGLPMSALDVMQGYKWTDQQRAAVVSALQEYREQIMPYLDYNPDGITGDLDEIREYLNRTGEAAKAAGKDAPVVVLDYLHLVSCKGQDIQETIKQSMAMLKQYVMQYDTFSIAITATNRESNKSGRITMESGRDSSGIEYGGDYILSLNYYQVEKGDVKPAQIEKIATLQNRAWRQMIVRVLKGRLCITGWCARVYFHAAGNRFYAEDAFLPDDANIVHFGEKDSEIDALDNPFMQAEGGPDKRNTMERF